MLAASPKKAGHAGQHGGVSKTWGSLLVGFGLISLADA